MTKTRLEAFSDGVIAIIITIMVLELKTPHGYHWADIKPLIPVFISYVLSFVMLGIYWGNHHHLLHTVKEVDSGMIWANHHLLFWLSLIPFGTAWMGENNFSAVTVAVYAGILALCGIAYYILLYNIRKCHPHSKELLVPLQKQSRRGTISMASYLIAIPAAFLHPAISCAIFIGIATLWLVPDRNIEKTIKE